jgi:hypothetical protein
LDLLLGQTAADDWLRQILGNGVFAGLFGFMLRWVLHDQIRQQRATERSVVMLVSAVVSLQKTLLILDANYSGLHAVTSEDEKCRLAKQKYEQLQTCLSDLQQSIGTHINVRQASST